MIYKIIIIDMKTTDKIALEGLGEFDLPVVEGVSNKPRVHVGGDVCVSCEG